MMSRKIWVVSELYYPEETSTGYFMTGIAEGLARHYKVCVLCSQPTYSARGQRAPANEVHNNVEIHRCAATRFDKDSLPLRLLNLLTISLSLLLKALLAFGRNDIVLVVTNPPLLPFLVLAACRLRGAQCLVLAHDVYPEVLVAAGVTTKDSLLSRLVGWFSSLLYRNVDRIVVLGRDMRDVIQKKCSRVDGRVTIIENWGDVEKITPAPRYQNALLRELGLTSKFVVQYSGNIGRTHNIERLVEAARALADHDDIMFLVIGSGAKKRWLEETVVRENLPNVVVLSRRVRDELPVSLNACDLAVIPLVPGMAGVSVPSRVYNILAAGKAILAVAESHSELAMIVKEEQIGWIVQPDEPDQIVQAILEAKSCPDRLAQMGANARFAVERKYSYSHILKRYQTLIEGLQ